MCHFQTILPWWYDLLNFPLAFSVPLCFSARVTAYNVSFENIVGHTNNFLLEYSTSSAQVSVHVCHVIRVHSVPERKQDCWLVYFNPPCTCASLHAFSMHNVSLENKQVNKWNMRKWCFKALSRSIHAENVYSSAKDLLADV